MLHGLDLFSGIGGIALALAPWVRPVAYCEIDRYAQSVLLSKMADGAIPLAPIWDDVRSLSSDSLGAVQGVVDIIYGGFPCQDISIAGTGKGLDGERSGLFFEICRLMDEVGPRFVFLENVPAITTRGGLRVVGEFASRGYDCRWLTLSAAEIGANHLRKRWFLLAHANSAKFQTEGAEQYTARAQQCSDLADPKSEGLQIGMRCRTKTKHSGPTDASWWATEPDVGRVAHGVPCRVDRIKGLGNAVVPLQARTAFVRLMGQNNL